MRFPFKEKSEDYLLHKLNEEIGELNNLVKKLNREQIVKSDLNRRIMYGMKEEGRNFSENLTMLKTKISGIVENQCGHLESIQKLMSKIEHLLNLLIYMEQVSLAIHKSAKKDDLSDMVDVHLMPLEKFKKEIEHIKMLNSSFNILRIELEKQKGFIQAFDFNPETLDERYFFESSRQEIKLSEEELISVSQLQDFCSDLRFMIEERMHKKMPAFSDSDKAAHEMIDELKTIKMSPSLFSVSLYDFIRKLVMRNVRSHNLRKLVIFLMLFLLSRLKRFKKDGYYSQLRSAILCFNLLKYLNTNSNQKYIITGATLLSTLPELDPVAIKESDSSEELKIIKKYYLTVNHLFDEEFTFMNTLLSYYHSNGADSSGLPWVSDGARVMRLVNDFDIVLKGLQFNPSKIQAGKDEIYKKLMEKNKGCEKEIGWLFSEWERLLPKYLKIVPS